LEKRGEVAYQLELPSQLSVVHDVFHVSQLKKCLHVPKEQIPMEELDAKEVLSYQEYPNKTLETVDVSYAALQAHEIINVALHREYSPSIVFIFSQWRKDLYHV
jgi:superfamily II RNA helicase